MVGVPFDMASQWKARAGLAAAAYYNLLIAASSTPLVLASGILAWRWQLEGAHLKGNLLAHLVLGFTSGILICLVWWTHRRTRRSGGFLSGVNN